MGPAWQLRYWNMARQDIAAGWRENGSPARLRRPSRQASSAYPRGKPGFSTFERRMQRDGLSAGGRRIRTFRPSRDQYLSELVEPWAETTWRARGGFSVAGPIVRIHLPPAPLCCEPDREPGVGSLTSPRSRVGLGLVCNPKSCRQFAR